MEINHTHKLVGDLNVIKTALNWLKSGHACALAVVTQTWGSAPRPCGSFLAINDQGEFVGSVSGGCIEGEVATKALGIMRDGGFGNLDFSVTDKQATGAGLACGGKVSVHVFAVTPKKAPQLEQLLHLAEHKAEAALLIDLGTAEISITNANNTPKDVYPFFQNGKSTILQKTMPSPVFLRPFLPPLRMFIIGAVHIAQDLAVMAQRTGYDVTLIDPRDTWGTSERFPGFNIDRRMPGEAIVNLVPDQRTAIVALCHDPKLDDPALVEGLKSQSFYMGALGSRKNHAGRLGRLSEYGFTESDLSRIKGPIGLNIGATTPAEIAISILAEITKILRIEKAGK
jgi:xanthine dehydrogenase accessory factor